MLKRVAELERVLRELLAGVELYAVSRAGRNRMTVLADPRIVSQVEARRRVDVQLLNQARGQSQRCRVEAKPLGEVRLRPLPATELKVDDEGRVDGEGVSDRGRPPRVEGVAAGLRAHGKESGRDAFLRRFGKAPEDGVAVSRHPIDTRVVTVVVRNVGADADEV